jgi:broad specificity phosphatase PhoE
MRVPVLLLFILVGCISCGQATQPDSQYSLYLVRHAEKQTDGSEDPALTAAGEQRAEKLATWLTDKDIIDVWSSDYQRSRHTANPSLANSGLELKLYDPRDLPSLATKLRDRQNNAVIVGHSNTTPQLAGLLCDCMVDEMDDLEYDLLFVVSVTNGEAKLDVLSQQNIFQP